MSPMPLYVLGHKNPDTDAICASIAYAELLNQKGTKQALPARCGKIPTRTEWVLKKAGVSDPLLLDDVAATAEMICRKDVVKVNQEATFFFTYHHMVAHGVRSIPVVDEKNRIKGILKYLDLLQLIMTTGQDSESMRRMIVAVEKMVSTIGAKVRGAVPPKGEREIVQLIAASSVDTVLKRLNYATEVGDIGSYVLICGDRPIVQRLAIEYSVSMLVVTGGFKLNEELVHLAQKKGVTILECEQDTATVSKLIRCSRMVHHAFEENILTLSPKTTVTDLRHMVANQRQDLFPVVLPKKGTLIGVISKSDLIDPPRIRLVLVDHNEHSQAVDGVEEAMVLEVIDHHRLAGDIVSREPIRYLNEPVGSTCTLVAREYRHSGFTPSKEIALCLLAGIISDTLNLTSPTTATLDRDMLTWVAEIAEENPQVFTKEFFASGSLLAHGKAKEILYADRKVFEENGSKVSISQIEEIDLTLFEQRKKGLEKELYSLLKGRDYNLALLAITNIVTHHSIILVVGNEDVISSLPFDRESETVFQAPGVVSRKKQLFPAVAHALRIAPPTTSPLDS